MTTTWFEYSEMDDSLQSVGHDKGSERIIDVWVLLQLYATEPSNIISCSVSVLAQTICLTFLFQFVVLSNLYKCYGKWTLFYRLDLASLWSSRTSFVRVDFVCVYYIMYMLGCDGKTIIFRGSRGQRPSLNYAVNRMSEDSIGNMRAKNEHISGSESPLIGIQLCVD